MGHLALRTTSNPPSILSDLQYYIPGSMVTIADRTGHSLANFQFSWWSLNGVRQEDASGAALGGLKFSIKTQSELVGNYIDPAVDSDQDGIKDLHEWTYYGTLAYGPQSDTDQDGFTYAEEVTRNQSPRAVDEMSHGGVSRRRSVLFTVNPIVLAGPPEVGELQATDITATTATLNARINALSSATNATFEYGTTPDFGQTVASQSILNGFIANQMSASLMQLNPDTLYYYRVIAVNSSGMTTSSTATFRTTGVRSGYAEWAAIYSIHNPNGDADQDGVENFVEYAFGMHPLLADQWKLPSIEWLDGRFHLTVTAPSAVGDVVYGAEYSSDLSEWFSLPDSGSGYFHEFITPMDQIGKPKLFVRWALKLSEPP
jgi:hypothetical protein